ncbi:MAG: aldo/keto reductase [Clostridia bacterium]|nr:aldo/keto reductase [Clostridia bacterium]
MQFKPFGNTGVKISTLGFGAMRLPKRSGEGQDGFDHQAGVALIRQAIDAGINYLDTAPYYCDKESELIVGEALRDGYRDKVYLSTKLPHVEGGYDGCRAMLESSLKRMQTDRIDFYHLWGINWKGFDNRATADGPVKMALKAKEEGLIRHLSFSFHDEAANMFKLIDTGLFASVLCQYNMLDRSNEEAIAYAHQKGLGVVAMGPVGGGRLGCPSPVVQSLLPGKAYSSAELALRFVLSNPNVDCALSGMGTPDMVAENVDIATNAAPLTAEEQERVNRAVEENHRLAELYCTGCDYCMPCPAGVNIPKNFEYMNYHRVYKITEFARESYAQIGVSPWIKGEKASACTGCGVCEEKCPQKIKIREQLAETAAVLG